MDNAQSMNGKYWKTCSKDISSSEGWLKKVMLLGLLNIIPVFGQMTLYGYAYEWAHKAAWGVNTPMPAKIYGREGSKMLRWGWFVIVIAIVFSIIPYIIMQIGSAISTASAGTGMYSAYESFYYDNPVSLAGNAAGMMFGGLIQLVGFVALILAALLAMVGAVRMTVYDRLGCGLQFKQIWKMARKDFGGLMRIFGMYLITGLIIGVIAFVVVMIIVFFCVAVGAGMFGSTLYEYAYYGSYVSNDSLAAIATVLIGLFVAAFPLMLALYWVFSCMGAWQQLLVARAVGYWTAQFEVAKWGKKDDPLPFENAPAASAAAAPQQPTAPAADAQPAIPQQPDAADAQPAAPMGAPVDIPAPEAASDQPTETAKAAPASAEQPEEPATVAAESAQEAAVEGNQAASSEEPAQAETPQGSEGDQPQA